VIESGRHSFTSPLAIPSPGQGEGER